MKKLTTLALAIAASLPVHAENFQSFTELTYSEMETNFDAEKIEVESLSFATQYFFDQKTTLGPLNEFEFINKVSNVGAGYVDYESGDATNVFGEAFFGRFLIGANYSNNDFGAESDDTYSITGGYLVTDNLLLKVEHNEHENFRNTFFKIDYQHTLSEDDYIGVSFKTDDETDFLQLTAKYFTAIGGGRYVSLVANAVDMPSYNAYSLEGTYYFNHATSIGLSAIDGGNADGFGIHAQHYFNHNWSIKASYSESESSISNSRSSTEEVDSSAWRVGISAQF